MIKETLIKYFYRHAGNRFVRDESGRTQYAIRAQTRDGLQLNQHPVTNSFYWIAPLNITPPSQPSPLKGEGFFISTPWKVVF